MDNKKKEESFRKARNIVLHLLKFRLRSEQELRDKLTVKKLPNPIVEQTLQYFKDLELIDDRQFSRQWISSRLKKPFGLNRIWLELKNKGIDPAIIQETLKEATQHYDELEIALTLARHRVLKYRNIDEDKLKQRIYGYLQRRGFNTSTIIKTITNI